MQFKELPLHVMQLEWQGSQWPVELNKFPTWHDPHNVMSVCIQVRQPGAQGRH